VKKVIIPVSTDIPVSPIAVEKHCAEAGFIVTNATQIPDGQAVVINGTTYRNGPEFGGVELWSADVVTTELEGEYDYTPEMGLPFEVAYSPKALATEEFFRRMCDKHKKNEDN
jgi:hypothetical protein